MKRILKWTGLGALVLLNVLIIALVLDKAHLSGKVEDEEIVTRDGIRFKEQVELGGVKQWIYVHGNRYDNPVLLYIHGGPGSPHSFGAHVHDKGLRDHFVVVNWDQRSAGKSFSFT